MREPLRVVGIISVLAVMAGLAAWAANNTPPAVSSVNYHIAPIDSREVMIVCTNGAQPLLSQSVSLPTVVSIKCMDIAAK